MNGRDNIAGYTLTVGTADVVITDSVATYDPIIGNLADGDAREYKLQFIDSSVSDQYETGIGTWNEGIATFSRDTVKTSSNGGAKEDFGAGAKVLFIVSDYESLTDMNTMVESAIGVGSLKLTTAERAAIASHTASIAALGDSSTLDVGTVAGTVAAGDDGRFGEVDIGDLDPGTTPDGTELVPALQGVDGVSLTTQQISGSPVTDARGLAKSRVRGYSGFNRTLPAFASTNGAICELEPFVVYQSGAGASVNQGAWFTATQAFVLTTGTTGTGYARLAHLQYGNPFTTGNSKDLTYSALIPAGSTLPVTQASTTQMGWMSWVFGVPALATEGMFFQASAALGNWEAVVKNAGGETKVDTGVAIATSSTIIPWRIYYDSDALATKFYIDGTLVATITNATRVVGSVTLQMVAQIFKSAGINAMQLSLTNMSYDMEDTVLSGHDY